MEEMVCNCYQVTKQEIVDAIQSKKLKTVEEVGEATNAGTGCGGCQETIQEILNSLNK